MKNQILSVLAIATVFIGFARSGGQSDSVSDRVLTSERASALESVGMPAGNPIENGCPDRVLYGLAKGPSDQFSYSADDPSVVRGQASTR